MYCKLTTGCVILQNAFFEFYKAALEFYKAALDFYKVTFDSMTSRTSVVTEKIALIPAVKWKNFPLSPRGAFLIEQVFAFHSNA